MREGGRRRGEGAAVEGKKKRHVEEVALGRVKGNHPTLACVG